MKKALCLALAVLICVLSLILYIKNDEANNSPVAIQYLEDMERVSISVSRPSTEYHPIDYEIRSAEENIVLVDSYSENLTDFFIFELNSETSDKFVILFYSSLPGSENPYEFAQRIEMQWDEDAVFIANRLFERKSQ